MVHKTERSGDRYMNADNLLEIRDLQVDFMTVRGIIYAVQGVSYNVRRGEVHGIVGESGCGKSVSSKTILRLHDDERTRYSGEVVFAGQEGEAKDIIKATEKEMQELRGKEISMIFQDPMTSLNPIMKTGEQIAELVRTKLKYGKAEARNYVLDLFKDVGILPEKKRYEQYPFEMSGGMLQRVMIAMALACKPKLLIADEPTTALDVTIQAQILKLIREMAKKYHTAVIFITHDLGVVAEICDTVSVLYAGKVVEHGAVLDIFDNPKHPYTKALLESNPKSGNKNKYMTTIPGTPPLLYETFHTCPFEPRCTVASKECRSGLPEMKSIQGDHMAACFRCEETTEVTAHE